MRQYQIRITELAEEDLENAGDYRALQETIYLNNIPGMAESIIEGGNTSLEDCTEYGDDW